jgi:hypothetical protein
LGLQGENRNEPTLFDEECQKMNQLQKYVKENIEISQTEGVSARRLIQVVRVVDW